MSHITYPNFVIWQKSIDRTEIINNFSKRHQKRLNSTIKQLKECEIDFLIEEVGDNFLNWFEEFYLEKINAKNNPHPRSIRETISKYDGKFKSYCLTITEKGALVGGSVYINKLNRVTVAFKAFKNDWHEAKLQSSPSLLSEYFFYEHAIKYGYNSVSHGQDNNPYGLNSDIGLCVFKLSLGYKPITKVVPENSDIDTRSITKNCLILNLPEDKDKRNITKADLFVSNTNLPLVEMLLKYPETLTVKTHLI